MEKQKQKNVKIIRNCYILAIAVVFLISFSIINSTDDGELNDYEIYTPEIVVNEVNELNQTSDINQASSESITGLLGFLGIIGFIIGMSWVLSFINSLILGDGTEYC